MNRREEILSKASEVVVIPSCAHKAMTLLGDPNADMDELASIIEHDPGLTMNLLKIVNASFFSGDKGTMTAHEAISRLGTAQVLQFVLSTGVAPSFVQKIEGYDLTPDMHMQHSVVVAMAAQELGRVLELDVPEYTYTAGLLAGVGKIVMGAYLKIDVESIIVLAESESLSFDQAEDRVLGINHAELGGVMMENWGLPGEITDVVRYHLRPDEYHGQSLALDLVHIGSVLAKMIGVGLGADGLNYRPSTAVAERLKLTPAVVDAVSAQVITDLADIWHLFIRCAEGPEGQ